MKFFLFSLKIYQKFITPLWQIMPFYQPFGGCRFYPSCSEYTRQAVISYGLVKGLRKGLVRLLKCQPFSRGGVDWPIVD